MKQLLRKLEKYMFVSFLLLLSICPMKQTTLCVRSKTNLMWGFLTIPFRLTNSERSSSWLSLKQQVSALAENLFCDCLHRGKWSYIRGRSWVVAKMHWSMGHRPNPWGALFPKSALAYCSLGMPAFPMIRRNLLIFHDAASTVKLSFFPFLLVLSHSDIHCRKQTN